jgi:ATP-dependent exoDNAse (exonuclease V) beta subunit
LGDDDDYDDDDDNDDNDDDDYNDDNRILYYNDDNRILSLELRHFYVAVTRSRERLWIFDENSEWNEPIRTYCKLKGLVKVTNEVDISEFAKESTSFEWDQDGRMFFEQQNYEEVNLLLKDSLLCNDELG